MSGEWSVWRSSITSPAMSVAAIMAKANQASVRKIRFTRQSPENSKHSTGGAALDLPSCHFVQEQPTTRIAVMDRPRIAITLGDPTGIGPEIVVRAWSDPAVHAFCRPLVVGHPEIVRRAARLLGLPARVVSVSKPAQAEPGPTEIPCIPIGNDDALQAPPGQIDARGGQAAYEALVAAAKMALGGEVDAITTGPLHKAA